MSRTQTVLREDGLTSRSAMWVTCNECGHVGRVLAVMASRVLRARKECPECFSTQPPRLTLAPTGAHVPAPEAHNADANRAESARLHTWIEHRTQESRLLGVAHSAFSTLADRFSRRKHLEAHPAIRLCSADIALFQSEIEPL